MVGALSVYRPFQSGCFEKPCLEFQALVQQLFQGLLCCIVSLICAKLCLLPAELSKRSIMAFDVLNNQLQMSLRLFCIILIFLQAFSLDYQDRCLYFSEKDNVCRVTHDLILLRINLDGKQTVTHTVWGETTCSEGHIFYWQIVSPAKQFADSAEDYYIYFSQDTRWVYVLGRLQQIIQRTKVVNATFSNVPYHCEIIGDGTIQHFGIDTPDSPPCTHYLKCDRITFKE